MFLHRRRSALRYSELRHRAVWHMCTNFSVEYTTTNFEPATFIPPTRPNFIWIFRSSRNVMPRTDIITRPELSDMVYYLRYTWYTRRFGSYFPFRPTNEFNRICFGAYYFYKKFRVPEVNICTVIQCLTVQCDTGLRTVSTDLLPPSSGKKDWWRCKTEATGRPEVLAIPVGLLGEFITKTPSKGMKLHTDWRRCPVTQRDRFQGCFSHMYGVKHTGVRQRTANNVRATHNYGEL